MLYGRSLSFCIQEAASGKINFTEIELIVTSTKARNKKEFIKLCNQYCKTYWIDNPEKCKKFALSLWDFGRIIQPRLKNDHMGQALYKYPIWANSKEEALESLEEM